MRVRVVELKGDNSENVMTEIIEILRNEISTMLSDGYSAQDLAFALGFVAPEMSMQLMTPTAAIPVVLHGVAVAAFAKSRQEVTEPSCGECLEEIDPRQAERVTVH